MITSFKDDVGYKFKAFKEAKGVMYVIGIPH